MANQNILVSCATCHPCEWVQATPCPGGPSGLPNVYFLKSAVGAGSHIVAIDVRTTQDQEAPTFTAWCYVVDGDDDPLDPMPPRAELDGQSFSIFSMDEFDSCGDCVHEGGQGGGVVIPNPPTPGGPAAHGWEASLCPGSPGEAGVWVQAFAGHPTGVQVFRWGGACWTVDESAGTTEIPAGVTVLGSWGDFVDCAHCLLAHPVYPCPGQGVGNILYVYPESLPPGATGLAIFRLDGVCYAFNFDDPDPTELPPPGTMVITRIPAEFEVCDDCTQGVTAEVQPCDPPPDDGDTTIVWVPRDALPGAEVVFTYDGLCYVLDPAAGQGFRPAGASIVAPADEFATCEDCLCGLAGPKLGIKAIACGGQGDAGGAEGVWVVTAAAWGDEDTFFVWNSLCWRIKAGTTPVRIPAGAHKSPPPSGTFDDCLDCIRGRTDGPRNPIDPPPPIGWPPVIVFPPPPPPGPLPPRRWPPKGPGPPRPPLPPGPAPGAKSNRLKNCADGSLTTLYVNKKLGAAGRIITLPDSTLCYEVLVVDGDTAPNVPLIDRTYSYCIACENDRLWYNLKRCDTGASSTWFIRKRDWIVGGGAALPVIKVGATCYVIGDETSTVPDPTHVASGPRFTTCAAPDCAECYCFRRYIAVWDCALAAWTTGAPFADGGDECGDATGHPEAWEFAGSYGGDVEKPYWVRWVIGQNCNDICGEGCLQDPVGDVPAFPLSPDNFCCSCADIYPTLPSAVAATMDADAYAAAAFSSVTCKASLTGPGGSGFTAEVESGFFAFGPGGSLICCYRLLALGVAVGGPAPTLYAGYRTKAEGPVGTYHAVETPYYAVGIVS